MIARLLRVFEVAPDVRRDLVSLAWCVAAAAYLRIRKARP